MNSQERKTDCRCCRKPEVCFIAVKASRYSHIEDSKQPSPSFGLQPCNLQSMVSGPYTNPFHH